MRSLLQRHRPSLTGSVCARVVIVVCAALPWLRDRRWADRIRLAVPRAGRDSAVRQGAAGARKREQTQTQTDARHCAHADSSRGWLGQMRLAAIEWLTRASLCSPGSGRSATATPAAALLFCASSFSFSFCPASLFSSAPKRQLCSSVGAASGEGQHASLVESCSCSSVSHTAMAPTAATWRPLPPWRLQANEGAACCLSVSHRAVAAPLT